MPATDAPEMTPMKWLRLALKLLILIGLVWIASQPDKKSYDKICSEVIMFLCGFMGRQLIKELGDWSF